eukprot:1757896-Pyramimonas_sp.AAC.1
MILFFDIAIASAFPRRHRLFGALERLYPQRFINAVHGPCDRANGMALLGGGHRDFGAGSGGGSRSIRHCQHLFCPSGAVGVCAGGAGAVNSSVQTLPNIAAVFDKARELGTLQSFLCCRTSMRPASEVEPVTSA